MHSLFVFIISDHDNKHTSYWQLSPKSKANEPDVFDVDARLYAQRQRNCDMNISKPITVNNIIVLDTTGIVRDDLRNGINRF